MLRNDLSTALSTAARRTAAVCLQPSPPFRATSGLHIVVVSYRTNDCSISIRKRPGRTLLAVVIAGNVFHSVNMPVRTPNPPGSDQTRAGVFRSSDYEPNSTNRSQGTCDEFPSTRLHLASLAPPTAHYRPSLRFNDLTRFDLADAVRVAAWQITAG